MPDIQTALKTALQEWDDTPPPAPAPNEPAKFNLSRALFDYVKANPGAPQHVVVNEMVSRGAKASSITSLLTQFGKAGLLELRDGRWYALAPEYRTIYSGGKATPKPTRIKPIHGAAPAPQAKVSPMAFPTADDILATLPVREAHALYLRLKEMFAP